MAEEIKTNVNETGETVPSVETPPGVKVEEIIKEGDRRVEEVGSWSDNGTNTLNDISETD